MEILLVPVSQTPQSAQLALSWAMDLWGERYPNYSAQDWADFYSNAVNANHESWEGQGQELVYIAKKGEVVVGTIALVDFDELEDFRPLTPWIAAFIVKPEARGEGLGTLILTLLEEKARTLGIEVLHLWTEDQEAFYGKRGYQLLARSKLGQLDINVMQKKLIVH